MGYDATKPHLPAALPLTLYGKVGPIIENGKAVGFQVEAGRVGPDGALGSAMQVKIDGQSADGLRMGDLFMLSGAEAAGRGADVRGNRAQAIASDSSHVLVPDAMVCVKSPSVSFLVQPSTAHAARNLQALAVRIADADQADPTGRAAFALVVRRPGGGTFSVVDMIPGSGGPPEQVARAVANWLEKPAQAQLHAMMKEPGVVAEVMGALVFRNAPGVKADGQPLDSSAFNAPDGRAAYRPGHASLSREGSEWVLSEFHDADPAGPALKLAEMVTRATPAGIRDDIMGRDAPEAAGPALGR